MNSRIQELARQAGLKWKDQSPHFSNTSNPVDFPHSANADLEKFAELIVKECLATVEAVYTPVLEDSNMMQNPYGGGYVQCGLDAMVEIKTKFNVTYDEKQFVDDVGVVN